MTGSTSQENRAHLGSDWLQPRRVFERTQTSWYQCSPSQSSCNPRSGPTSHTTSPDARSGSTHPSSTRSHHRRWSSSPKPRSTKPTPSHSWRTSPDDPSHQTSTSWSTPPPRTPPWTPLVSGRRIEPTPAKSETPFPIVATGWCPVHSVTQIHRTPYDIEDG